MATLGSDYSGWTMMTPWSVDSQFAQVDENADATHFSKLVHSTKIGKPGKAGKHNSRRECKSISKTTQSLHKEVQTQPFRQGGRTMISGFKKALGAALVLGWASAALAADNQGS